MLYKVLEHAIANHDISFLDTNELLSTDQHGLRNGLPTVTQLTETLHDFYLNMDAYRQRDVISVDIRNAVDKVSHHRLPFKLNRIGISSIRKYRGLFICVSTGCKD